MRIAVKTAGGIAAVLLSGGIAAGCATSSPSPSTSLSPATSTSQPAPATTQPSPATTQPSPSGTGKQLTGKQAADALAWADGPGYKALMDIGTDMSSMPDPSQATPAQWDKLTADLNAAKADPMPASIDPDGHYTSFLDHMRTFVQKYRIGDLTGALTALSPLMDDYKGLMDEMNQVTDTG